MWEGIGREAVRIGWVMDERQELEVGAGAVEDEG
jgi:hypothetical protein